MIIYFCCILFLSVSEHVQAISSSDVKYNTEFLNTELETLTQLIIRLAQCRANCLDKFGVGESKFPLSLNSSSSSSSPSLQHECWNTCNVIENEIQEEDIKINVTDHRHQTLRLCSSTSSICLSGCQEACRFFNEKLNKNPMVGLKLSPLKLVELPEPVTALPVEPFLTFSLQTSLLSWPSFKLSPDSHFVYTVVQHKDSSWEVKGEQTSRTEFFLELDAELKLNDLRVLAVNSKGLTHVYSFKSRRNEKKQEDPWHLKLNSMIHQKFLVLAELKWDCPQPLSPKSKNDNFFLTWEVYGGLVRGHLLSDSNLVSISLWPNTGYTFQVALIDDDKLNLEKNKSAAIESLESSLSSGGLILSQKSNFLNINTSLATFSITKKSSSIERKRSASKSEDEIKVMKKLVSKNRESGDGIPTFCHWSTGHTPTKVEIRSCRLIWSVLFLCFFLFVLFLLGTSIVAIRITKKNAEMREINSKCSVSSVYGPNIYKFRRKLFRWKMRIPFNVLQKGKVEDMVNLSDMSDFSSSDNEDDENAGTENEVWFQTEYKNEKV